MNVLQTVDAGGGLEEGGAGIVADVHGEPGPHRILRRSAGALQVSGLERDLGYVRVVEGMPDLPENLPRGGLEVHGGYPSTSEETAG